jgi:hypothetical protein
VRDKSNCRAGQRDVEIICMIMTHVVEMSMSSEKFRQRGGLTLNKPLADLVR